jgi:hypothetical protein
MRFTITVELKCSVRLGRARADESPSRRMLFKRFGILIGAARSSTGKRQLLLLEKAAAVIQTIGDGTPDLPKSPLAKAYRDLARQRLFRAHGCKNRDDAHGAEYWQSTALHNLIAAALHYA